MNINVTFFRSNQKTLYFLRSILVFNKGKKG